MNKKIIKSGWFGREVFIVSFLVLLIGIFTINFIHADAAQSSVSSSSIQYSNSFGGSYSSLMSGASNVPIQTQDSYDAQFYIPPLGCQPYVVRSDLLEEQNVPVFCKLVPLKINPAVTITRIKSIIVTQKEKNDYISGVSFHPAKAVIGSSGSLVNNPSTDNIGYVVVVLKQNTNENSMPDFVNVTLSARMDYAGENMFGVGDNELYVPELSDADFQNKKEEYSFFNGVGYLKVDALDENSAAISVYTSDDKRVFSQTLTKGTTSREFYLNNYNGGEGIKFTLKDITLPETQATINVNGNLFNVYKGGSFYNGKCTLLDVQALSAGSGTVKVKCGIKTFNLQKKLNSILIQVNGNKETSVAVGEDLDAFGDENYYFLAYSGQNINSAETIYYSFISQINKTDLDSLSQTDKTKALEAMKKAMETAVSSKKNNLDGIKSLTSISFNLGGHSKKVSVYYFDSQDVRKVEIPVKDSSSITFGFKETQFSNAYISEEISQYFANALDSYGFVSGMFAGETYDNKYSYGEHALWQEYNLAEFLGQKESQMKILSDIMNQFPLSKNKAGKTAAQLINEGKLLSSEGSSDYSIVDDISVELVSVKQASLDENSVLLHTSKSSQSMQYYMGAEIYNNGTNGKIVTLERFTDDVVYLNCTYLIPNGKTAYQTLTATKDKPATLSSCDNVRVIVDQINRKKVAKITLTPVTSGKIKESNFSFTIGIEKRAEALKLTPEQANERIKELDKSIKRWTNITESLGKFIEVEKAACMATTIAINIKNLVEGRSGLANARTAVMSRWNAQCESPVTQGIYDSTNVDDCIANAYEKDIKPEIEASQKTMKAYNDLEQKLKESAAPITNTTQKDSQIKKEIAKSINTINAGTINTTKINDYTYQELSNLYLNLNMQTSLTDTTQKEYYAKNAQNQLDLINGRIKAEADALKSTPDSFSSRRISGSANQVWSYENKKYGEIKDKYQLGTLGAIADDAAVSVAAGYVYVFDSAPGKEAPIHATKVFEMKDGKLVEVSDSSVKANFLNNNVFQGYDASLTKNKCSNCVSLKAFSTEPYRGMPQLIPFDCANGWYVQVDQANAGVLGTSTSKSYFDSGALNSFWICNVGPNKLMEGKGIGDDGNCIKFDLSTGQPLNTLPGLSEADARAKINSAIKAIQDAQTKLKSNPSTITINDCPNMEVRATTGTTAGKCTDFMSPKECQLIFNVCDPVVCPNSRCDLGGKYQVDNVIQSGIVGSSVLCLPNFIGFNGKSNTGVVIPVCLTGIHAGIQGWVSVLTAYKDCLNDSITQNKTTGICDMLNSVYICDFFWRQVAPFSESLLKNLFINLVGSNAEKGGAEYNFAGAAFQNMQNSMAWMQTTYAKDSKLAFGTGSLVSSVVAQACKSSFSATYPSNFDKMLEPESPIQYTANYEEISYTDATVPPSSQYKVFYHIFAGNDNGHYYSVYLKTLPTGIGYSGKDSSVVASGYVSVGQTVSETKDFIDVSGYKELCVRIDNTDKCGFKTVSTSFVVNYAKDKAVQDQVTTPVTTEKSCISGTQSAGALLTPNIQQAAEEFVNPELYNQGVIRVCSGVNPGKSVEPARWQDAGYCGDTTIRCWVDTNSVKKAITGAGIEKDSLSQINNMNLNNVILQNGYLTVEQTAKAIQDLDDVYLGKSGVVDLISKSSSAVVNTVTYRGSTIIEGSKDGEKYTGHGLNNLESDVKILSERIADSGSKAKVWMIRAQVYDEVAKILKGRIVVSSPAVVIPSVGNSKTPAAKSVVYSYDSTTKDITASYYDGSSSVRLRINQDAISWSATPISLSYFVGTLSSTKQITIDANRVNSIINAELTDEKKILILSLNGKALSQISSGKVQTIVLDSSNNIIINGEDSKLIQNESAIYYDNGFNFEEYNKVAHISASGKITIKSNFQGTFYDSLTDMEQKTLLNNFNILKQYSFINNDFVSS